MHNPSGISQNQLLLVKFPDLGSDDVIIPATANLCFNIELSLRAYTKRALVSNIDRVIIKKLAVQYEENQTLGVDNFDVFACYQDLWKTELEK